MSAGQGKLRCAVIKCCRRPCRCRVTGLAILIEIPGDVIRVDCLLKVRQVALDTVCIHELVVAIRMAGQAGLGHMTSSE